jgi:hypothetical protein
MNACSASRFTNSANDRQRSSKGSHRRGSEAKRCRAEDKGFASQRKLIRTPSGTGADLPSMQTDDSALNSATGFAARLNKEMERERARYQKDLQDFERTVHQTRTKYQGKLMIVGDSFCYADLDPCYS